MSNMESNQSLLIITPIIILIIIPIIILSFKDMEEDFSIVLIRKICCCKVNSYLLNKKRLSK